MSGCFNGQSIAALVTAEMDAAKIKPTEQMIAAMYDNAIMIGWLYLPDE
jgi:hypothetical protein